jgi:hypothetical protein
MLGQEQQGQGNNSNIRARLTKATSGQQQCCDNDNHVWTTTTTSEQE